MTRRASKTSTKVRQEQDCPSGALAHRTIEPVKTHIRPSRTVFGLDCSQARHFAHANCRARESQSSSPTFFQLMAFLGTPFAGCGMISIKPRAVNIRTLKKLQDPVRFERLSNSKELYGLL